MEHVLGLEHALHVLAFIYYFKTLPFNTSFLHEILQNTLTLANKGKNRKDIHQEQGRNTKITGTLTVHYFFSQTEFLPC